MYSFILNAHSGWAYIALIALVIAIANAFIGLSQKRVFGANDRRLALFGLIGAHVQFALGLVLYFVSPNGLDKIRALGMGGMNSFDRLLALEHPLINLIAIILITIGWSKHKRSETKFRSIAIFYALGLLLLLSRIPWSTWFS
jgi:hypothetical protein